MKVSELITKEEINTWKNGDTLTIQSGTGTGKSFFIKNSLYEVAKENGQMILFLIHRTNCINQFQMEIEEDKKTDVIELKTYQSIEARYKKGETFDFSKYHYIVCDEFHYFMNDTGVNKFTDVSLDNILNENNSIRILMSATGGFVRKYLEEKKELNLMPPYRIARDYNFIKSLQLYYKNESLIDSVEWLIKNKHKTIIFINNVEEALNLYKQFKEHSMFVCSKSKTKEYKYVDESNVKVMLKEERFETLLLITTSVLDTGVNILDDDLHHIICDISDVGTLVQCVGRKRLKDENDYINLLVKGLNGQQIGWHIATLKKRIKKADYFLEHGEQKYLREYPRESDEIIYSVWENDRQVSKVNEIAYFAAKCSLDIFEQMIRESFKTVMSKTFLMDENEISLRDKTPEALIREIKSLEEYLEYLSVNKIELLRTKDRIELISKINLNRKGKPIKGRKDLNGKLDKLKLSYQIEQLNETSRIGENGKKENYKAIWVVKKINV